MYFAQNVGLPYFPFNSWLSFQRLRRVLWGLQQRRGFGTVAVRDTICGVGEREAVDGGARGRRRASRGVRPSSDRVHRRRFQQQSALRQQPPASPR